MSGTPPRFKEVPQDLMVVPWLGREGSHSPRGDFAEQFYLPLLGPGALVLARNLAWHLDVASRTAATYGCYRTTQTRLALDCGLTGRLGNPGKHSVISRTVNRLLQFALADLQPAQEFDGAYLLFCQLWPDLTLRQAARLPDHRLEAWERDYRTRHQPKTHGLTKTVEHLR